MGRLLGNSAKVCPQLESWSRGFLWFVDRGVRAGQGIDVDAGTHHGTNQRGGAAGGEAWLVHALRADRSGGNRGASAARQRALKPIFRTAAGRRVCLVHFAEPVFDDRLSVISGLVGVLPVV